MGKSWEQYLQEGEQCLREAGIAEAELDAWYLFSEAFQMDRTHYFLKKKQEAKGEEWEERLCRYQEWLGQRAKRIPLQQILKTQEFMALPFVVSEQVLIPRQDTETLVELVLSEKKEKGLRVLDLCTGSGCIALSLAVLGGYRSVTAADLSLSALQVAERNVEELYTKNDYRSRCGLTVTDVRAENKIENKIDIRTEEKKQNFSQSFDKSWETLVKEKNSSKTFWTKFRLLQSDLFEQIEKTESFDIVVSNPPYIPSSVIEELEPEVRDYEPRMALDGHADGLYFYRRLAEESKAYLAQEADVYFEIGHDQGEALREILAASGFEEIRIVKDLSGKDRVAAARWKKKE
ncbi:MAG: HemK/PrmC family methyltransferase [bacterium]|nr:HemK/PrmC family methyltransferase [bacterium]